MTTGQRWRWRRDLVIALACRAGLSHRFVADVFDLPHSRVQAILRKVEAERGTAAEKVRRARDPLPREMPLKPKGRRGEEWPGAAQQD